MVLRARKEVTQDEVNTNKKSYLRQDGPECLPCMIHSGQGMEAN